MPWIEPVEQYATPPRLPTSLPEPGDWNGSFDDVAGVRRLDTVAIRGTTIEAEGVGDLQVLDSTLDGCAMTTGSHDVVDIVDSVLTECDLSRVHIGRLKGSKLTGCKLVGTDFSHAELQDVELVACTLTYTNFRMAELTRVAFEASRLDDVDFADASLHHCSTHGCDLQHVNVDRAAFDTVDLRGTRTLGLAGLGGLDGCLVGDAQLQQLAYDLALASGASIERDDASTEPSDHSTPK